MSLEDNLKKIHNSGMHSADAIPQIMQAFEDEGWQKPWDGATHIELNPGRVYMTGKEWFERFISEYKRTYSYTPEYPHGRDAIEAAKKASGIDE